MTEPEPQPERRTPLRMAIIALSIALVAVAALVAFLIWGRPATTVVPSPSISPSVSPTTQPPSAAATSSPPPTTASPSLAPTSATATSAPPVSVAASTSTPATASATAPVTASATAPATIAPTTAAAPPAAAQTMRLQGKATFEHFTAEVLQDDANQDSAMIDGKAGLLVEVCATQTLDGASTTRLTSQPWTLEDSTGNVQSPQSGGYQPAFPADGAYVAGQCDRGFLTFDYLPVDIDYGHLVYENGLGDRAVWQFH